MEVARLLPACPDAGVFVKALFQLAAHPGQHPAVVDQGFVLVGVDQLPVEGEQGFDVLGLGRAEVQFHTPASGGAFWAL